MEGKRAMWAGIFTGEHPLRMDVVNLPRPDAQLPVKEQPAKVEVSPVNPRPPVESQPEPPPEKPNTDSQEHE